VNLVLDDLNVSSRGTLGAAADLESDLLALLESAVTVTLDSGEVDEEVSTGVTGDEAETLGGVEPLDSAELNKE